MSDFDVHLTEQDHRTIADLSHMLQQSSLAAEVKQRHLAKIQRPDRRSQPFEAKRFGRVLAPMSLIVLVVVAIGLFWWAPWDPTPGVSAADIAASVWRQPEPGMGRSFDLSVTFATGPNGQPQEVVSQVFERTTSDGVFSRVTVARDPQGEVLARYIVEGDSRWLDTNGQITSLAENQLTTVSPAAAAALSAAESLAQPQMETLSELLDSEKVVKETNGDIVSVTVDASSHLDAFDIEDLSNLIGNSVHSVMISATVDTSAKQLLNWSMGAGPSESDLTPVYVFHFQGMENVPVEGLDETLFNTQDPISDPDKP